MLHLSGLRVGKLSVTFEFLRKDRYIYWICICDCGNKSVVRSSHLKAGTVNSCGCDGGIATHGLSRSHPLYGVWQGIKSRCYNSNAYGYFDYGARGIKMSDEWRNSFEKFYEDMLPTYKEGLTIERKNTNGDYCKENCSWETRANQAKNRRSTIWIETEKGKMTIQDAAKEAGISWVAMYQRYRLNWPKDKILSSSNFKLRVKNR